MGAFAVDMLVKFGEGLKNLADEFSGVALAEKEMAEYARENETLMEELGRKSTKVAHDQVVQILHQVAVQSSIVESMKARAENVANFTGGAGMLMDKLTDQTKKQAEAEEYLKNLQGLAGNMAADHVGRRGKGQKEIR